MTWFYYDLRAIQTWLDQRHDLTFDLTLMSFSPPTVLVNITFNSPVLFSIDSVLPSWCYIVVWTSSSGIHRWVYYYNPAAAGGFNWDISVWAATSFGGKRHRIDRFSRKSRQLSDSIPSYINICRTLIWLQQVNILNEFLSSSQRIYIVLHAIILHLDYFCNPGETELAIFYDVSRTRRRIQI